MGILQQFSVYSVLCPNFIVWYLRFFFFFFKFLIWISSSSSQEQFILSKPGNFVKHSFYPPPQCDIVHPFSSIGSPTSLLFGLTYCLPRSTDRIITKKFAYLGFWILCCSSSDTNGPQWGCDACCFSVPLEWRKQVVSFTFHGLSVIRKW